MRIAMTAVCLAALVPISSAWALEPAEVAVVYNADFEGSQALAEYYVLKRGVPKENVLSIRATREEVVDRAPYFETIQKPVRAWLAEGDRHAKIRCLLLMRGVPLVIWQTEDAEKARARNATLAAVNQAEAEKRPLEAEKKRLEDELARDRGRSADLSPKIRAATAKIAEADARLKTLREADAQALRVSQAAALNTSHSVESALAVMDFPNVPVQGGIANLLNWRTWSAEGRKDLPKTFMTCRLDGPTDALVRRVIDDSIAVEAKGLEGVAYVDAWGKHAGGAEKRAGIIAFDDRIRALAAVLDKTGMKTVLDDADAVFQPNTCPNAALYCGWYSLEKYVPAFRWVKGAVGFHVASWEARSLRRPNYEGWCKRMLEEGAAATFGPTWEPYVGAFPDPSAFYAFLLTGRYTVAESYWYTAPFASWTLTLVADPLYTPFKRNPRMTLARMREVIGMPAPK